MSFLDWVIVSLYVGMIFGIAFWPSHRSKRTEAEQYFLAGRDLGWFTIGASIFAANVGSDHLIGLAGSGAASGLPVAQFEIMGAFALLILGWLFVPFYFKTGVFTMPEFLERRYASGPRLYLAAISVVGYVLTKISVIIAAGGIVFETLMGVNFWAGAIVTVVLTGLYTIAGGLRAVMYTELLQAFLIIGGSVIVTAMGLHAVGGWQQLQASAAPQLLTLWRPMSDPEFPWTGLIFGTLILGIWYWCTDQFIVQRTLSARSIDEARKGTIFAALLKQLPLFLFVLPGLIAHVLRERGVLHYAHADQALPALIGAVLPAGLKGLVVAGFVASLMSSLSAVFNSCSTIITMDLYRHFAPQASDHRLKRVGQWATAFIVCLGLAWIPLMGFISNGLYTYIQSVQSYIAPPIAAVFLVGVVWPRANARGAMATLLIGFTIGAVRLLLEMRRPSLSGVASAFVAINFLHFAILLFGLSVVILVAVSRVTAPPTASKDLAWVFQSHSSVSSAPLAAMRGLPWLTLAVSAVTLLLVLGTWIYFS